MHFKHLAFFSLFAAMCLACGGVSGKKKQDESKMMMSRIAQQVDIYQLRHNNRVPSSLMEVFTVEPVPQDAWGNEFKWESGVPGGRKYDLISYGADGRPGGNGNNADIRLSEL